MKFLLTGIAQLLCMAVYSQKNFTVYFDFNKYNLTEAARLRLDSFLLAEKQNVPDLGIQLNGHCDAIGSDEYNDKLSKQRVTAVKKYFLGNGIQPYNIGDAIGHGKKEPLNENKTEEERQLNRRVEISFIRVVTTNLPVINSLKEKIADSSTIAGTSIALRNINFVGGRRLPLPQSRPILDELLATMKAFPHLIIEIDGNICCQEGDEDGFDLETNDRNLSEMRAKTIADWLIYKGIESNRVSYKGFGHSQPIYPYPEKTEEERIANRRVEIKIISK